MEQISLYWHLLQNEILLYFTHVSRLPQGQISPLQRLYEPAYRNQYFAILESCMLQVYTCLCGVCCYRSCSTSSNSTTPCKLFLPIPTIRPTISKAIKSSERALGFQSSQFTAYLSWCKPIFESSCLSRSWLLDYLVYCISEVCRPRCESN